MRTFIVTLGSLVVLTLCTLVTGPSAQAQGVPVPDQCDNNTREQRGFTLGVRKGRNLAQQAIRSLGDNTAEICQDSEALENLEDLILNIVDDIEIPSGTTQAARCQVFGQVAGLVAEITDFQEECPIVLCFADGEFIGEISALLYCELSIELGGLVPVELFQRLATDACGENFQDACDAKFEEVAEDDPECVQFTVSSFEEVFLEAQNNQCADNPLDPEPTPTHS